MDWYAQILASFGFDPSKDEQAREVLCELGVFMDTDQALDRFQSRLIGRIPAFFGAGPSLMAHIKSFLEWIGGSEGDVKNFFLIAADGAANGLDDLGLCPDLIVTDLDGLTQERFSKFLSDGSFFSVLGHGDNLPTIAQYSQLLQEAIARQQILLTTQVTPIFPVINPGGFTDGDRGAFLCQFLTSANIPFLANLAIAASKNFIGEPNGSMSM